MVPALATCEVEDGGVPVAVEAVEPVVGTLAGAAAPFPCGTSARDSTPAGGAGAAGAEVSAVWTGAVLAALRPRGLKRVRSTCFFFLGVGGAYALYTGFISFGLAAESS